MSFDLKRATKSWVTETEGLYKVANERDWKLVNYFLPKDNCVLGLGEISPSNGHNNSEVGLDLELKPPCNPQPKFSWSDGNQDPYADTIDLSLSLVGNLVKPQQCDEGVQETMKECDESSQETIEEQLNLQKSSFVHVESKAYEGDGPFKATEPNHLVLDKDLNIKFDMDLNSVCIESEDGTNTPNNSSKPLEVNEISNEIAKELVSQDQLTDNNEAGHIEFKWKELNAAKIHSGADGVDFVVSEGNKITALDNMSNDNRSSFSKIDSDVAESGEEYEEYEEVFEYGSCDNEEHEEYEEVFEDPEDGSCDNEEHEGYEEVFEDPEDGSCDNEEHEEYEEVFEDGSCDNEEHEEYEEVFEDGSCDNESDSSHDVVGADDAGIKEYEGVMEEVSCDAESDNPSDEYADKESRKLMKMDDQEVERTMIQSQDDAREKQIQDHKEYIDKRKVDATVPENLHHLALDAPITTEQRLLKSGLDKDIAEDVRGKHIQTPQECINKREYVVTRKAKQTWGTIPSFDKDDATQEIIQVQEWGTKSGINKGIADASESVKNEIGRRVIARRVPYGAHSRAGTGGKEKLNVGPNRSSYKNQMHDHGSPIPSRIKRRKFPNKSFRCSRSGRHRDDRCNEQYRRSDNDMEGVNQFGKRRSDYTWVRKDHVGLYNAIHCEGKERACEGQIQNIRDSRMPQAREGKIVARDFPDCSAGHFSFSRPRLQHMQTGDVQRKTSESPNIVQNRGAQQYNFGSSSSSQENPSTVWRGARKIFEREKMQSSHQGVSYSHDSVVTSHASVHEDARGINSNQHQYSMRLTPLQKNIEQRSLDIYPRQTQEESFRHSQYINGGEHRLSAEFDKGCYGVENNLRPARYEDLRKEIEERRKPRESERNLRNRLGETSNGARSAREKAENSMFRGKKRWPDAEFSNARLKITKY